MEELIFKMVLVISLFLLSMGVAAYSTWAERKVAALLQDRVGPNRAGFWGLLQPLADGGKFFFKEDFIPRNADKFLFILGPGLVMFVSLITGAVIPWGKTLNINGQSFTLQVASIDIGVLYLLGMVSIGVYGVMIGGWASNNKYSLIGAIRASSQMISYELAMGLALLSVILMNSSLDLKTIVENQGGNLYGIINIRGLNWNIFYQPMAFLIFFTAALAECNRHPFDLSECETELVGGFHTEYSSMKLGLYLFGEYVNMFISCALITSLFLGGYQFSGLAYIGENFGENFEGVASIIVFLAKTFFLIFVFMWIRWTLPRFRYDQLMHLGWRVLIPLALVNLLITAGGLLVFG